MEDSSSYADYFSALVVEFIYVPIALLPVIIYSVIVIKLKTQKLYFDINCVNCSKLPQNEKVIL